MHVLAHQGGWDEVLLVLLPVSLFAALLFVANRRAARLLELEERSDRDTEATDADTGTP